MAAVFVALAALLGQATGWSAPAALFGSCFVILDEILPRWGVDTEFVDGHDLDQWREALSDADRRRCSSRRRPTRCRSWSTSAAVAELAHAAGAQVVVDNVFAHAGVLQRRSSSAPTSSSTRPPSTSTVRAACSAARSSGRKEYIDGPVQNLMRHTGPSHVARSTPGSCSRAWRRCRCGCEQQARAALRLARCARGQPRRVAGASTRGWSRTRSTSWPRPRCTAAAPSSPSRSTAARTRRSR